MSDQIELYTDGACRGNPGPGGWGALLRSGQHEKHLKGAERQTTNNRMELLAAVEGLKAIKQSSGVLLVTDSQYMKQGMESWIHNWKKNNWKTAAKKPVKNQDLWQALDEQVARHQVTWKWVKGHSGHAENELVDQLANQAIDELG